MFAFRSFWDHARCVESALLYILTRHVTEKGPLFIKSEKYNVRFMAYT